MAILTIQTSGKEKKPLKRQYPIKTTLYRILYYEYMEINPGKSLMP